MVRLTVDGQHVEVPQGATILEAAEKLGIAIPTLCHVSALPPLSSCFVCVVQVVGQRKLVPSCAVQAAEGMVVLSESPEVRQARRTALELLLSDHFGECLAPCEISCPAGLRIPAFMTELMEGRLDRAGQVAREDLVLPGVLGRICPRFCENACRRQEKDQSIAIGQLHRYAAERQVALAEGAGAAAPAPLHPAPLPSAHRVDAKPSAAVTPSGKKVAIVGAGPAGLAAASFLLRKGHACTLFDANAEPGGTLRYALDEARLPRQVLAAEVEAVRRMGAEFRMNVRLGADVSLAQLRSGFDAVLLAVGAPRWQRLDCPGGELAEPAGDWLRRVAQGQAAASAAESPGTGANGQGQPANGRLDEEVLVIGAGHETVEVARAAVRHGAEKVIVLCSRPAEHLPLVARQIELAKADGVLFHFAVRVQEIRRPARRFYVTAKGPADELLRIDGLHLIAAVGRDADIELLSAQGLATGKRGVQADRDTLATSVSGVFAAGEAVSGGGFCVRAVAYGRAAAESIDQFLCARPVTGPARPFTVRYGKLGPEELAMLLARARNPSPRAGKAGGGDDVAVAEAARCLLCGCRGADECRLRAAGAALDADTTRFKGERRALARDDSHPLIVYESNKCVMCGACVAVAEQAGPRQRDRGGPGGAAEGLGLTYVGRGFNVRVGVPMDGRLADALNELASRCAAACPTSAIVLKNHGKPGDSGASG